MSYQQFFVVIALVIPVLFLANVVQYRKFSKASMPTWLLILYGTDVLGFSIVAEVVALQFVFFTGLPSYSTENMPLPNESLNTGKWFLLDVVCMLFIASLLPALAGDLPWKKPPSTENDVAPVPEVPAPGPELAGSESAGRIMMTVGLTALFTAALMIRRQRSRRVAKRP